MKITILTVKNKLKLFVYCLLTCLAIQSCSFFNKTEKLDHLTGIVRDDAGNPLKDVVVTSANVSVKTDENGLFNLERIANVDDRYVVSFSRKGYFRLVRSGDQASAEVLEVVMQPTKKAGVSNCTTFSAAKGSKVKVGKTQVNIPSNSLVRTDGSVYKGNVDLQMLYLDPKREDFAATMPGGDLSAKDSTGAEKALVSYGMIDVVMLDDKGGKLQLKSGSASEVTFPIPEGMADKAPAEMPLWSFNEENGVWEQSGVAVRDGDVYKGTVGHFSWVNLDDPKDYCVLHGTVVDEAGNPLSGLRVSVEQVAVYTKADGSYSVRIPSETPVKVSVKSGDYNGYTPEVSIDIEGQPGNSKFKQDLKLPALPTLKGKVKNTCGDNTTFTLFCKYEKDGKQQTSGLSMCKTDGTFMVRLPIGATNPVLFVSAPDGQTVEQKVENFSGSDIDLGDINACYVELVKREQPQLSIDGQNTPIDYDDCDYAVFREKGKAVEICFNNDLEIYLENYTEKSNKFNARIKLNKQGYQSTSAQVERVKVDNRVQLKITSVGYTEKDSVRKDAKFDAVVYSKVFYNGACESLNKICLPKQLNKARMPITYAFEQDVLSLPDIMLCYDKYSSEYDAAFLLNASECDEPLHLTLAYKHATKADAKLFAEELVKKGFVKKNEHTYEKNDISVDIHQGNLILTKSEISTTTQMVVSVSTGFGAWIKGIIKKYFTPSWLS